MSTSPPEAPKATPELRELANPKLERAEFLTRLMRLFGERFSPVRQGAVLLTKDKWTVLISKDPIPQEQQRLHADPILQKHLNACMDIGDVQEIEPSTADASADQSDHRLLIAPLGTSEFPQVAIYLFVPESRQDTQGTNQQLEHLRSIMLLPLLRQSQRSAPSPSPPSPSPSPSPPSSKAPASPKGAQASNLQVDSSTTTNASSIGPETVAKSPPGSDRANVTRAKPTSEPEIIAKQATALVAAISGSIDKEKVSYEIANELCRYLKADRVSVIDVQGSTPKLLAASGVPSFDKRSPLVRSCQELVKPFIRTANAVHFNGQFDNYPPKIQKRIEAFLDESMAQSFRLIPVVESQSPYLRSEKEALIDVVDNEHSSSRQTRAWILIELISRDSETDDFSERWSAVQTPVANQIINAKRHSELALLKPMQGVSKFTSLYRGHTARTAFGITFAVLAVLVLGFSVKTDFLVRCEGHVRSQAAKNIFVQTEGVVEEILVKEGDPVIAGQLLLKLRDEKLMQELARNEGECMQTQSRLDALMRKRHRPVYDPDEKAGQNARLLAEESAQLEETLRIQKETLELTKSQITRLDIRAPIDGVILGWNIDRRYSGRPLERGTLLFSVADPNAEKQLDLKVPTKRAGYIRQAFLSAEEEQGETMLRFSLASQPDQVFNGRLLQVNAGLEEDSDLGYVLRMKGIPLDEMPPEVKNGIPVIAKVNCGRESFFYCKSYEFLDWLNRTTFEYF